MSLPQLSPQQLVKPPRFELRLSLIYVALFIPMGIHLPFLPLWLDAQGFGAEQIAVILSVPMFVRVVTTPLISALADRARDRAHVLVAAVAGAFLSSLGYFLPTHYGVVLAVSVLLAIAMTPHAALTDSLALSGVRRWNSNYAGMRIWGSISFLAANVAGGMILAVTGPGAVPVIMSCGFAAGLAATSLAPRLGPPRRASPLSAADLPQAPKLLNRFFVLFVLGAGIINGSHGYIYAFGSIYWDSIGVGDTTVGLLWAAGVFAEVLMFMNFNRFFGRVSAPMVLALAGVAGMVRWAVFPFIAPAGLGVAGFFAAQALHAFSTALNLIGVQKLIGETVAEERTGAAQGAAFFANGLAMALVTLVSGSIYDRFGVHGFLAAACIAGLGTGFILLSALSAPERGRGR